MPETNRNRGSPRLLFTQEEREDPKLERLIDKAKKAGTKADKAQKKLKTKRQLVFSKVEQPAAKPISTEKAPASVSGKAATSPASAKDGKTVGTTAKDAVKKAAPRLHFEETKAKPPSKLNHPAAGRIHAEVHRQLADANEDDNTAVQAVLKADDTAQSALQMGERGYHALQMRP